jgi:hypothetical protein
MSPPGLDHAETCWEDLGRFELPQRPGRGGIHPLQLVHLLRASPSDLLLLPFAPEGVRAPAAAPHPPLHPSRVHVCPLHGDVCGAAALHHHLQTLLRPGRVREEQVCRWRLLLLAAARDVQFLHQRLLQRQVGGLACRLGHRHDRRQRPPRAVDRRAPPRPQQSSTQY